MKFLTKRNKNTFISVIIAFLICFNGFQCSGTKIKQVNEKEKVVYNIII
jgi:hypothetical protein